MISISNHSEGQKIVLEFIGEVINQSAKKQGLDLESKPVLPSIIHEITPISKFSPSPSNIERRLWASGKRFSQSQEEYNKSQKLPTPQTFVPAERNYLKMPPLVIPQPKLPERFQYLKPLPSEKQIDLGKLNPFLKDPMVVYIECNGPGQEIIVNGKMGRKRTGIFLDRQEIEDIVNYFSVQTKIPVGEGVYNVVYGKYQFSAIVSEMLGAKFTLKKMLYNPVFR
ncbi:hypothetical protein HYT24_03250 [Candidatus Pacearchaeota archaeon]|nr:hypothetical protein [Candidatus Pacearchaeota archaeon]